MRLGREIPLEESPGIQRTYLRKPAKQSERPFYPFSKLEVLKSLYTLPNEAIRLRPVNYMKLQYKYKSLTDGHIPIQFLTQLKIFARLVGLQEIPAGTVKAMKNDIVFVFILKHTMDNLWNKFKLAKFSREPLESSNLLNLILSGTYSEDDIRKAIGYELNNLFYLHIRTYVEIDKAKRDTEIRKPVEEFYNEGDSITDIAITWRIQLFSQIDEIITRHTSLSFDELKQLVLALNEDIQYDVQLNLDNLREFLKIPVLLIVQYGYKDRELGFFLSNHMSA